MRSGTTLVSGLVAHYSDRIVRGQLRAGSRLPSVRQCAILHKVSRFTVLEAYDRLVASGLVESRRGSGFFVRPRPAPAASDTVHAWAQTAGSQVDVVWLLRNMFKRLPARQMPGAGVLPVDWLDAELVGQAIRAAARQGASALLDYGHPQGYLPLREQLAARLSTLDIPATPDGLMTTAGVTQALDIVAQYALQRGDVVLVDEPSWFLLFGRFATLGVRVLGVPRLPEGPDLAVLEQLLIAHRPRLFVTSSVLQSPTGASISLRCAHRLLKLAGEHQLLLVEDDVYSDLDPGSGGGPGVRLAALDGLQQVIYLGGFSKTLAANLRVGFVAASAERVRELTDLKMLLALTSAELNERVVYQVLSEGHYRRHLHRLRDRLDPAREQTIRMLERLQMRPFVEPQAGMYVYADTGCDANLLTSRMLEQGYLMAPGSLFMPDQRPSAWMRFNVATSVDPAMIACLERTLAQVREVASSAAMPGSGPTTAC